MKSAIRIIGAIFGILFCFSCNTQQGKNQETQIQKKEQVTAKDILGNPDYLAISYGGYRERSRDIQPTIAQLKEDLKILAALGIRIVRTYNTKLAHAGNVLNAIRALKNEDSDFEMYVMLGAWIDCENARTPNPNHEGEDVETNTGEVERAIRMANEFPDIVKIIAVGNEAMVKWATSYYVQPWVILKWVNHLQELKEKGQLPKDLWITSSDNFASWGGGGPEYHVEDLTKLFNAVDFVSIHTYPMHDTHYNPDFWKMNGEEVGLSKFVKIDSVMARSKRYAMSQYQSVIDYMRGLGVEKPVHIGETGWATASNSHYGPDGSGATDEYKAAIFYKLLREWTDAAGITCFYFEAFDEIWKDAQNPGGSENHFGLFKIDGKAKYALWELVDQGVFEGLSRDGNPIEKTYNGNKEALLEVVLTPEVK
jgi:exo-beta-1,3-glucanase (GH17 family)